jgi:hypothetical protein
MRSALVAGIALTLAATAPALAQNTTPGQPAPGTTTQPPAAQPATPPAAQPATPPAARPATPAPGTQAQPAQIEGSHLIGLTLRNSANESIGEIDDVIVGSDGRVTAVVVGVGGFLGIGEHKVAIAWNDLRFDTNRDVAVVSMTKEQLRAMPEYRADRNRNTNTMPAARNPANTAPATPGTAPAPRSP